MLSPYLWLYGGLTPITSLGEGVNLQLQVNKNSWEWQECFNLRTLKVLWPAWSGSSGRMWLFTASQLWEAWAVLKLSKYRLCWEVVTRASLSAERFDLRHPCHTQGRELAVIIGTTNEEKNPSPIYFLINLLYYTNDLLTSQKSLYLESFKTSCASHCWEAVNNHMRPDEPDQAGQRTFRVRELKHSCHA